MSLVVEQISIPLLQTMYMYIFNINLNIIDSFSGVHTTSASIFDKDGNTWSLDHFADRKLRVRRMDERSGRENVIRGITHRTYILN